MFKFSASKDFIAQLKAGIIVAIIITPIIILILNTINNLPLKENRNNTTPVVRKTNAESIKDLNNEVDLIKKDIEKIKNYSKLW